MYVLIGSFDPFGGLSPDFGGGLLDFGFSGSGGLSEPLPEVDGFCAAGWSGGFGLCPAALPVLPPDGTRERVLAGLTVLELELAALADD